MSGSQRREASSPLGHACAHPASPVPARPQLRDFLKFFATKREVFDTEIAAQFRDVEAAR